ncbi:diguanylate cyclase (GGDEF) domain-containing protein [Beggiatoa alba B18LD]|uniref:diguanylate cyclase n=1 Tax=Beggiatoa alba B18LD TaxID=395493 RepID=I3CBQ5_9GAMM|nr:diguanylate cyclase [Beggiatoa alba]EIJ41048.1 diguanylate cyclase (GGDEF) domain-containing protein [Beggiatoa alba B18LD]
MTNSPDVLLIVEDRLVDTLILTRFLNKAGFKVISAKTGEEGIQLAITTLPDLILLDVMMPGINGFDVCKKLKTQKDTSEIPVVFMTALTNTPDKLKAFDVGASDYITKPLKHEEVLARINAHLKIRKLQRELQIQNQKLQEEIAERKLAEAKLEAANRELQQEITERKLAEAKLEAANRELQRLANLDGLTQVANRRLFDQQIEQEWKRHLREKQTLSVILCDVDHFKNYNDNYGHIAGDNCLQLVAMCIQNALHRSADIVARYGGEEFIVILPNTKAEGAIQVSQLLIDAIKNLNIPYEHSPLQNYVTVSLGVASVIPDFELNHLSLIGTADKALYIAKAQGRNQAVYCEVVKTSSNIR